MRTRARFFLTVVLAAPLIGSSCLERSSALAEVPFWTIDATPRLEITDDDPDGEVRLGNAVHVTRRPDGGLLVSDQGLHSLRLFSSDGRFQRAIGRQGSGPGEFEFIRQALRCGDSLFVEDIVTRRVTVHSLDGTITRTMSTSEFSGGTEAFRSACNADGVFVHHAWNRFDPTVRGRRRTPLAVWITSAARDLRVALPDVDGPESVGFGTGAARALLGRSPQLGIGRRHVYVGAADSGAVEVYALDGTPAGTRRLPETDLRVTAADLDRAKRIDSLGQDATTQKETRRIWELDTPPSTRPAYDALPQDDGGGTAPTCKPPHRVLAHHHSCRASTPRRPMLRKREITPAWSARPNAVSSSVRLGSSCADLSDGQQAATASQCETPPSIPANDPPRGRCRH